MPASSAAWMIHWPAVTCSWRPSMVMLTGSSLAGGRGGRGPDRALGHRGARHQADRHRAPARGLLGGVRHGPAAAAGGPAGTGSGPRGCGPGTRPGTCGCPAATAGGIDGPSTQMVVWAGGQVTPGEMLSHTSMSRSRSDSRPWPSSIRSRIFSSQPLPSRQGVHWPHDSRWKKRDDAPGGPHRAGGVIHGDHRARAGHGPDGGDGLVGQEHIEVLGPEPGRGRAARDEGLQLVVVPDAAAEPGVVHEVPEAGLGPFQLVVAGPFHVAGQGQELGALRTALPEGGEVVAAVEDRPRAGCESVSTLLTMVGAP